MSREIPVESLNSILKKRRRVSALLHQVKRINDEIIGELDEGFWAVHRVGVEKHWMYFRTEKTANDFHKAVCVQLNTKPSESIVKVREVPYNTSTWLLYDHFTEDAVLAYVAGLATVLADCSIPDALC